MLKLSPDEAALLRAVCADRDNDLPRLVYADYLDDNGRHERAEFIRIQVALHPPWEPSAHNHLQPRLDDLLMSHRDRWTRELPKWATGRPPYAFFRGFVEDFAFPAAHFLRYGPQLLDRTPVRSLALHELRRVVDDLVRCPWLREVPHLDLSIEALGDEAVSRLVAAEWLVGTRHLNLEGSDLGDRAAVALAGCCRLSGLTALDLQHNRIGRVGLAALLASPHLTGCSFHLFGNARLHADAYAVERMLGPRGTL